MKEPLYLKCKMSDIAPRVLLSGDPARVDQFVEELDGARLISRNREYSIATGTYNGKRISAVSAGIGGPSNAIALEELKLLGVRTVVRMGTMMALNVEMSSLIIPIGAVRYEGTSSRYLPLAFPAIPHWDLAYQLAQSGEQTGLPLQMGLSATYDAFYPDMAPDVETPHPLPDWEILKQAGVLGMDMETALVFIAGQVLGLATAAICLTTVSAGPPMRQLENDIRVNLEKKLLIAAMNGLTAYEFKDAL
jgi:uridine phosphorylase